MRLQSEQLLSRARAELERSGAVVTDLIAPDIAASWTRCLEAGLDPQRPPALAVVDEVTLRTARDQRELLRRLVVAEMQNLYHQIAGTNYMIAFAAPDGLLLDTIADTTFGATARATSIRPGTLWTELRCGTNALGTAAAMSRHVTVHGPEHFFHRYGALTCTAAPLFDPSGELVGVLDASSDCRSRQEHTRALVSMAASQVENGLLREHYRKNLIIAFHSRGEFLHTLSAGLLAVDADGLVLAANRQALFLLQGLPATRGQSFDEIFRTSLGKFLDASRDHERQRLEDREGSVFTARIESMRPERSVPVVLPAPSRSDYVAEDPIVAAIVGQVEGAARKRVPILVRGETGTGKEQLARHAHQAGSRRGAFVAVNCAALPGTLIESELFGHADGAFTGARRGGAPGLVMEADGGTLFLDEIGDMPLALQAVLLRLLDDWTVRPVGGGRRRQVDIQLVAATNADLAPAVAAGRFRADLLYRINTVEVFLPRLAQRSDFAAVARQLLSVIAPGYDITTPALGKLAERPWPGNVRELRNVLTRLTLAEPSGTIGINAVTALGEPPIPPPLTANRGSSLSSDGVTPPAAAGEPTGGSGSLRDSQREQIIARHHATGGNVSETARQLGVSRNTIYRALRL